MCSASAEFEDFVLQFMDRYLFDHLLADSALRNIFLVIQFVANNKHRDICGIVVKERNNYSEDVSRLTLVIPVIVIIPLIYSQYRLPPSLPLLTIYNPTFL